MPQFNRLGGDMDEANAECAAMDEEDADRAHETLMTSLVEAVKNHAKSHYNEGGWDMVVECYEDTEIREEIAGCTTPEQAIARLAEVAHIYHDRRLDAWLAGGLDENGRLPDEKCDKSEESHSHCTCQDADDMCDFCSYTAWMSDLRDSGPTCDDGGYRPHRYPPPWSDHICYNQSGNIYGTYTGCFVTQSECDNDIPF